MCDALREACGRLGVVLDPAPAYSPFLKGKVEAAGKSVDRALSRRCLVIGVAAARRARRVRRC